MNTRPLDELFLGWLYSQVADDTGEDPSKTYWNLLRQMYIHPFYWMVEFDENRVVDVHDLRVEFIRFNDIVDVSVNEWLSLDCSMLELAIVLSRRLQFLAGGTTAAWFWILIENIGLMDCDDTSPRHSERVTYILDQINGRYYAPSGRGGFFPLEHPRTDQREVELWYQLEAYVLELQP